MVCHVAVSPLVHELLLHLLSLFLTGLHLLHLGGVLLKFVALDFESALVQALEEGHKLTLLILLISHRLQLGDHLCGGLLQFIIINRLLHLLHRLCHLRLLLLHGWHRELGSTWHHARHELAVAWHEGWVEHPAQWWCRGLLVVRVVDDEARVDFIVDRVWGLLPQSLQLLLRRWSVFIFLSHERALHQLLILSILLHTHLTKLLL